jgi:hypothetical protein
MTTGKRPRVSASYFPPARERFRSAWKCVDSKDHLEVTSEKLCGSSGLAWAVVSVGASEDGAAGVAEDLGFLAFLEREVVWVKGREKDGVGRAELARWARIAAGDAALAMVLFGAFVRGLDSR